MPPMPTKSRILLSTLVVALLIATISVGMAVAKEDKPRKPEGKWMPHGREGLPGPWPCTGDDGVFNGALEYFWDADRDGAHNHGPGHPPPSMPSEPTGCFTDEQLKGHDDKDDS